jgi:hypothetical protein
VNFSEPFIKPPFLERSSANLLMGYLVRVGRIAQKRWDDETFLKEFSP